MGPGTLTTTIDEMLALDPTSLSDDEIHQWVIGGQRAGSRLVAFNAAMIERVGVPQDLGRRRVPIRGDPPGPRSAHVPIVGGPRGAPGPDLRRHAPHRRCPGQPGTCRSIMSICSPTPTVGAAPGSSPSTKRPWWSSARCCGSRTAGGWSSTGVNTPTTTPAATPTTTSTLRTPHRVGGDDARRHDRPARPAGSGGWGCVRRRARTSRASPVPGGSAHREGADHRSATR